MEAAQGYGTDDGIQQVASEVSAPSSVGEEARPGLEDPYFMPHELLLTFTSTTDTPERDSDHVTTLVRRANGFAGGSLHEIVKERPGGHTVVHPPLTLRVFTPPPHGGAPSDHVKHAINRINERRADLQHQGISVSSAMPNWVLSGANGAGKPTGGPGTIPDPAPPANWGFTVPAGANWPPDSLPEGHKCKTDQNVIVAVLDTWPGKRDLTEALERYPENHFLQDLIKGDKVTVLNLPEPPRDMRKYRDHAFADHGLFVAGIVNKIAPHARIHVLHVLDDQGLGRTDLLLDGLDHCLSLAQDGHRVVVNLSLYLQIPPEDLLLKDWSATLAGKNPVQIMELLDALDEAVEHRITLLLDAGAVVVAAAGNDGLDEKRHPQPRLPADYDLVLCVVAADRSGRIAKYSNRADVPLTGNCVAVYGGQGIEENGTAVVPPGADPRDGVVGLYTQPDVTTVLGSKPNTSGWAYWSGTSFATPVVSAMAANLFARDEIERRMDLSRPRLTPRGVMAKILALAEPKADPALGCPYVRVRQVP